MLLITFKLTSLLSGFLMFEVVLIWNSSVAVSFAADIPANELASDWSNLSIVANVNCVGEKWVGSGIPYGSLLTIASH